MIEEADEQFTVQLFGPNRALIGDGEGLAAIRDDDSPIPRSELSGKITFVSQRDGNPEIYVMNAEGTAQTRLTNNRASDSVPCFSADGSKIAFQSNRDSLFQIYVMRSNGSNLTRLTSTSDDFSPAFSPDGTAIVFAMATPLENSDSRIVVGGVDGTNRRALTTGTDFVSVNFPTFSPDGKQIAFSLFSSGGGATPGTDGGFEVFSINPDGTNLARVTFGGGSVYPCYSPDGSKIVFAGDRSTGFGLFIVRSQGNGEIFWGDGDNPSWALGSVPAPPGRAPTSARGSGGKA